MLEKVKNLCMNMSASYIKKGTNAPFNITFNDNWKLDEVENYVESLFSTGELEYEERWVG